MKPADTASMANPARSSNRRRAPAGAKSGDNATSSKPQTVPSMADRDVLKYTPTHSTNVTANSRASRTRLLAMFPKRLYTKAASAKGAATVSWNPRLTTLGLMPAIRPKRTSLA